MNKVAIAAIAVLGSATLGTVSSTFTVPAQAQTLQTAQSTNNPNTPSTGTWTLNRPNRTGTFTVNGDGSFTGQETLSNGQGMVRLSITGQTDGIKSSGTYFVQDRFGNVVDQGTFSNTPFLVDHSTGLVIVSPVKQVEDKLLTENDEFGVYVDNASEQMLPAQHTDNGLFGVFQTLAKDLWCEG